jgi:hypothetical protein
MLRKSNQALLEFKNISGAIAFMKATRGAPIDLQYFYSPFFLLSFQYPAYAPPAGIPSMLSILSIRKFKLQKVRLSWDKNNHELS